MKARVIEAMNDKLESEFTRAQIDATIKQVGLLKSPGLDGFGACFFQARWKIGGDDTSKIVLDFLNGEGMLSSLNFTYIVLIPKLKKSMNVSFFRPISLCNVLYKIISEVLANRLRIVLPLIISCNQSVFFSGRLISSNVMIVYKILHSMKTRQRGKTGSLAMKLDTSKAYNRGELGLFGGCYEEIGVQRQVDKVNYGLCNISYLFSSHKMESLETLFILLEV